MDDKIKDMIMNGSHIMLGNKAVNLDTDNKRGIVGINGDPGKQMNVEMKHDGDDIIIVLKNAKYFTGILQLEIK